MLVQVRLPSIPPQKLCTPHYSPQRKETPQTASVLVASLVLVVDGVEARFEVLPVLGQFEPVEELHEAEADGVHAQEIDQKRHEHPHYQQHNDRAALSTVKVPVAYHLAKRVPNLLIVHNTIIGHAADPAPLVPAEPAGHVLAARRLLHARCTLGTPVNVLAFHEVTEGLLQEGVAGGGGVPGEGAGFAEGAGAFGARDLHFPGVGANVYDVLTVRSRAEPLVLAIGRNFHGHNEFKVSLKLLFSAVKLNFLIAQMALAIVIGTPGLQMAQIVFQKALHMILDADQAKLMPTLRQRHPLTRVYILVAYHAGLQILKSILRRVQAEGIFLRRFRPLMFCPFRKCHCRLQRLSITRSPSERGALQVSLGNRGFQAHIV
ncbi:hypothetical protein FGO68_gene10058 [Halteria grandinella]|uniref:Uncharacterized protein n=1 Tax=Halteria grandinella TaxID=5974 RepID=A0A8J8T2K7_HALGN|nr:hypothetical protein FGO68_gene10058 [Halteria grandinella]